MKEVLRKILRFLHLDITKNLEYDRLTVKILKQCLSQNSNCVDVGCHKGEILETILQLSPNGQHYAFEPIPEFHEYLVRTFGNRATILPYALADVEGITNFHHVRNAPAYSGINKRRYDIDSPDIEELTVELKTLDQVIPEDLRIDLIKIDVEGAELGVLRGAKHILSQWHPVVIFECGLGASDFYGTGPEDVFNFLSVECGLRINTLKNYLNKTASLRKEQFAELFNNNSEYYFIAFP